MPIDNEGHQFLVAFDLKYGAVVIFDQKKRMPRTPENAKLRNEERLVA